MSLFCIPLKTHAFYKQFRTDNCDFFKEIHRWVIHKNHNLEFVNLLGQTIIPNTFNVCVCITSHHNGYVTEMTCHPDSRMITFSEERRNFIIIALTQKNYITIESLSDEEASKYILFILLITKTPSSKSC